jgi:hypothetical protein
VSFRKGLPPFVVSEKPPDLCLRGGAYRSLSLPRDLPRTVLFPPAVSGRPPVLPHFRKASLPLPLRTVFRPFVVSERSPTLCRFGKVSRPFCRFGEVSLPSVVSEKSPALCCFGKFSLCRFGEVSRPLSFRGRLPPFVVSAKAPRPLSLRGGLPSFVVSGRSPAGCRF